MNFILVIPNSMLTRGLHPSHPSEYTTGSVAERIEGPGKGAAKKEKHKRGE